MRDRVAITFAVCLTILGVPVGSAVQGNRDPAIVSLPSDRTETIKSPDGMWVLIARPISQRTIWLENRSDHKQVLVKQYPRSAQMGWSPDSRAFFLNDAYGSNLEDAFIYWIGTKEPLSINDVILAGDKEAGALPADHAYFQVVRWLSAHKVWAEYCGHGGEHPARQFDFHYELSLDGPKASETRIHRISKAVTQLDSSKPDCRF